MQKGMQVLLLLVAFALSCSALAKGGSRGGHKGGSHAYKGKSHSSAHGYGKSGGSGATDATDATGVTRGSGGCGSRGGPGYRQSNGKCASWK